MRRASWLAALAVLVASTAFAGTEPVAVVDLYADPTVGLVPPKAEEVGALTETLRAELALTGRYNVVAGERVAQALASRGVTPRACALDCLIAVGREVGAERVVTGRVVRMMTLLWGVDLHVVDVARGTRRARVGEFKGDYLVLKQRGIRQLVREIAEE